MLAMQLIRTWENVLKMLTNSKEHERKIRTDHKRHGG